MAARTHRRADWMLRFRSPMTAMSTWAARPTDAISTARWIFSASRRARSPMPIRPSKNFMLGNLMARSSAILLEKKQLARAEMQALSGIDPHDEIQQDDVMRKLVITILLSVAVARSACATTFFGPLNPAPDHDWRADS